MIASLSGVVSQTAANSLVVDVGGVGYLVHVAPQLAASKVRGNQILLHTRLIVREDAMTLFGFESFDEASAFDLLTSVTGVGPKSGLAILASLSLDQIASAIQTEDDETFRSVPGVGPKTAKLITVTLAGKFVSSEPAASSQLLSALVGLGYSQKVAAAALAKVPTNLEASLALRAALAVISKAEAK
ncbi:MAG: Holliday junction branch migration protein RuvA [Microbacteriaceae bacterium]